MKPVVYIAGPMRGHLYYNHAAFDEAAEKLEAMGFEVINPAEMDRNSGFDVYALGRDFDWNTVPEGLCVREVFHRDTEAICNRAHCIYMLPGWQESKGANAERALFRALGLYELRLVP